MGCPQRLVLVHKPQLGHPRLGCTLLEPTTYDLGLVAKLQSDTCFSLAPVLLRAADHLLDVDELPGANLETGFFENLPPSALGGRLALFHPASRNLPVIADIWGGV